MALGHRDLDSALGVSLPMQEACHTPTLSSIDCSALTTVLSKAAANIGCLNHLSGGEGQYNRGTAGIRRGRWHCWRSYLRVQNCSCVWWATEGMWTVRWIVFLLHWASSERSYQNIKTWYILLLLKEKIYVVIQLSVLSSVWGTFLGMRLLNFLITSCPFSSQSQEMFSFLYFHVHPSISLHLKFHARLHFQICVHTTCTTLFSYSYEGKLDSAKKQGIKKGTWSALTMGVVMMIVFLAYALGFWYGSKLVIAKEPNFTVGRMLIVSRLPSLKNKWKMNECSGCTFTQYYMYIYTVLHLVCVKFLIWESLHLGSVRCDLFSDIQVRV